jgi:integrase
MYKYALMNEIAEKDYSQFVFSQACRSESPAHTPFTPDEIRALWEKRAYPILIMIYTGLRVTEFLTIETENVDLKAHIMRGGIKTKAGKNRIIPIHDDILPLIRDMMGERYLYGGDYPISYSTFTNHAWRQFMDLIEASHTPHDTRHTAASLMEQAGISLYHQKLILGHAVKDITQGIYTHVDPSVLVEDINRIPSFK